ncbi:hypothetical protein JAAARDRAFT_502527 [Jaapia argillacea MUCL 33604]|uniref:Nephrocystin 3-like N-terminal domain-containing protein n=1 Tax=Jaapia argillacea MUCL 33604 TaxID=933084 RepID=A0A067PA91_9AGAM|nr:hypothetical protein JAAARDRAFT_502527 [Jaapia argillacea MUCL 33604]
MIVRDAACNCQDERQCQEGSRDEVIAKITEWGTTVNAPPIFWLYGPAGSGKSTIARTVSDKIESEGDGLGVKLAASWVFSRRTGRTTIAKFFPTIAYQLAISLPWIRADLERALGDDPSILNQTPTRQFKKLVIRPIKPFRESIPTPIIIVDGLDECDDVDADRLMEVITAAFDARQCPLRFLVTSRTGCDAIQQHFDRDLSKFYHLNLWCYSACAAIRTFFQVELRKIYDGRKRHMNVKAPWPSTEQLDVLASKADGLFIYASTLVKFVAEKGGRPDRKLEEAMERHNGLDSLYHQVLSSSPSSGTPLFQRIIGSVLCVPRTLDFDDLADLLSVDVVDMEVTLEGCHSILQVPDTNCPGSRGWMHPLQFLHASLPDFFTREERSKDYFIDIPKHHVWLLVHVIRIIEDKFSSHHTNYHANPGLFIDFSPGLSYACKNWRYHFGFALELDPCCLRRDHGLVECLRKFLAKVAFEWTLEMWMAVMPRQDQCNKLRSLLAMVMGAEGLLKTFDVGCHFQNH